MVRFLHVVARARAISLATAAGVAMLLAGCASPRRDLQTTGTEAGGLKRFEFTQPQMGVPFRIVLYAPDAAVASNATRAAFARIAGLNAIMSDYEDDSEVTRLTRTAGSGRAVKVSDDLWRVLQTGQAFAKRTEGAFDLTIGAVVQLWRRARRQRELPDPPRLNAALQTVGYRQLILDSPAHTARLLVPGMRLDLGSIAKGDAADQALKALRAQGITRALVAGGGDMAVGDPPPGKPGWRIEVAPLDVTNAPPRKFVWLAHAGLATSGDLFQHVEIEGRRYSHIVDPRTGIGLTDRSLVTAIAPSCLIANGLSTSVSVLGPEAGLKLIESTPHAAAHIMRQPAERIEVFQSKRFGKYVDTAAE